METFTIPMIVHDLPSQNLGGRDPQPPRIDADGFTGSKTLDRCESFTVRDNAFFSAWERVEKHSSFSSQTLLFISVFCMDFTWICNPNAIRRSRTSNALLNLFSKKIALFKKPQTLIIVDNEEQYSTRSNAYSSVAQRTLGGH